MAERANRCATCVWWQSEASALAVAQRNPTARADVGTCHIMPPVVMPTNGFPVSLFPETHADRFCGEWEGTDATGGGGEPRPKPSTPHLRSVA